MLDVLRKNSKHWLVTIIIGVVIVGLTAFFGSASKSGGGAGWAAKVDGKPIKLTDFITRYSMVVENYRQKLGPNFDEKILSALNIKMQVLRGMVSEKIVFTDAEKNGFGVSKTELVDRISKIPAFQRDGKFSMEYYNSLLSYNRLKPAEFEDMQRGDMVREKMRDTIVNSAKANDDEILTSYKMENEKTKLSFTCVERDNKSVAEVKREDIKTFLASEAGRKETENYYTQHNSDFNKGDKVMKFEDAKENVAGIILAGKKAEELFRTKTTQAANSGSISSASRILNSKIEDTELFNRKSPSISKVRSSSASDVLWAFSLAKGKVYKRDVAGRTCLFAVKERTEPKRLSTKDKAFVDYKKGFLSSRGMSEFTDYIQALDKRWAKKVVYSSALIREEAQE
ncbi:MAG: SurA N-terminal domain-containing protein [Pseudomonadota bacterium]